MNVSGRSMVYVLMYSSVNLGDNSYFINRSLTSVLLSFNCLAKAIELSKLVFSGHHYCPDAIFEGSLACRIEDHFSQSCNQSYLPC